MPYTRIFSDAAWARHVAMLKPQLGLMRMKQEAVRMGGAFKSASASMERFTAAMPKEDERE